MQAKVVITCVFFFRGKEKKPVLLPSSPKQKGKKDRLVANLVPRVLSYQEPIKFDGLLLLPVLRSERERRVGENLGNEVAWSQLGVS